MSASNNPLYKPVVRDWYPFERPSLIQPAPRSCWRTKRMQRRANFKILTVVWKQQRNKISRLYPYIILRSEYRDWGLQKTGGRSGRKLIAV
jgi:hypothetical protein